MKNTAFVFVGSVDGCLTAAALVNHIGVENYTLHPTQAFTVQETLDSIPDYSNVWFVDLAVNNRNPDYTKEYMQALLAKGCVVRGIVDEHDAAAWQDLLGGTTLDTLIVRPVSQKVCPAINSAGAVLLSQRICSMYVTELCLSAHLADNGVFRGVGELVNKAIKSDIKNQLRRAEIVRILSKQGADLSPIMDWAKEYDEIERNMKDILAASYVENGVVIADSRGKKVDMTSLMFKLYEKASYCCLKGQAWDGNQMVNVTSFGTSTGTNMQEATGMLHAGFGFAKKWNVSDELASTALANLQAYLANQ